MIWKDWSYKKRGGIIGLLIAIIFQLNRWFLFSQICARLTDPLELFNFGGGNCSEFSLSGFLIFLIILLIISLIMGTLPGILIGSLYSKINFKYNPFKMWSSWVFGVIGSIMMYISGTTLIDLRGVIGEILGNLLIFIVFFLLGWGIHSLIRKYKK